MRTTGKEGKLRKFVERIEKRAQSNDWNTLVQITKTGREKARAGLEDFRQLSPCSKSVRADINHTS